MLRNNADVRRYSYFELGLPLGIKRFFCRDEGMMNADFA